MYNNLIRPNVSKQNSFHFIRLVCCLIVIYEHSVGLSGGGYLNLQLASTAVATFFILSGFGVFLSTNCLYLFFSMLSPVIVLIFIYFLYLYSYILV